MSPDEQQIVDTAIENYKTLLGGLLPALHHIQDALGYIPDAAVPAMAEGLNLSRAEIHGVISYYHHFHRQPCGKHRVEICRAEACQARGAYQLDKHARQHLACDYHQTTADGAITLEPVYCLGLCAHGPAISIDGQPYARISPQRFEQLIQQARET